MDNNLNFNRSDKGKRHKSWVNTKKIGMYDLIGRLEVVFDNISDASHMNKVGANYSGIYACVTGKTKKHKNKVWKEISQ